MNCWYCGRYITPRALKHPVTSLKSGRNFGYLCTKCYRRLRVREVLSVEKDNRQGRAL